MLIGLKLPKSYIDLAVMVAVCKFFIPIKTQIIFLFWNIIIFLFSGYYEK